MVAPKVSIIVPVYNVEPYFEECVDSLRKQTMEDIEIILVDDGSPDGCPAMCDRFAAEDERIRVIHQENAGVSVARNQGIDAAEGNWLMFVDPDDWLEENAVEILYGKALESGCGIVYTPLCVNYSYKQIVCNATPTEIGEHSVEQNLNFFFDRILKMLNGTVWLRSPCGSIYKKCDIISGQCHFPAGLKWGEDAVFNLYAIMYAKEFYILDIPLYHYRQRFKPVRLEGEQEVLRRYSREIHCFLQRFFLIDEFKSYYYYAIIRYVFYFNRTNSAYIHNWNDLQTVTLSLRQLCEMPECAQAIRTIEFSFIPNSKQKITCWLLKKKLYWVVVLRAYLHHRLSKGSLH